MDLLILEGNTPDLVAARVARGLLPAAEAYGEALRCRRPGLRYRVIRPYFDEMPGSMDGVDGLVITGSGVDWSADDPRARPFWRGLEAAFLAGCPVLGSCWGVQCGAVVLGGTVGAGPNGVEAPVARAVTLTEAGRGHPMHAGRAPSFDVLCMHRDDVLEPPRGARVTATNLHTQVQALVYEQGAVQFWGVQYHPEIDLRDVAAYLARRQGVFAGVDATAALAAACERIASNPRADHGVAAEFGFGEDVLDPARHGIELTNWLDAVEAGAGATAR